MTPLETLADLGFTNATTVATKGAVQTIRIRTSKGWTYEKFTDEASVRAWAVDHRPEAV